MTNLADSATITVIDSTDSAAGTANVNTLTDLDPSTGVSLACDGTSSGDEPYCGFKITWGNG
jgi:hypothetical protein